MPHIVKRRGHKEPFDPRKVYASVYAACRNAHLTEIESEKIAEAVSAAIQEWISDKSKVASDEIFQEIIKVLKELEPDAAFLYETHRDIA